MLDVFLYPTFFFIHDALQLRVEHTLRSDLERQILRRLDLGKYDFFLFFVYLGLVLQFLEGSVSLLRQREFLQRSFISFSTVVTADELLETGLDGGVGQT